MKNTKIIGAFAAAGFLLSFVSGLFSGGGAIRILGMALLFAFVFALIGAAIDWLSQGVLNVSSNADVADDNAASDKPPKPGATIDVVIKDEELPSEENSPRFFVGNNHQMLNASDYGAKKTAPDPLMPSSHAHTDAASTPPSPAISASAQTASAGAVNKATSASSSTVPSSTDVAPTSTIPASNAFISTPIASSTVSSGTASASSAVTTPVTSEDAGTFEPMELATEKLQSTSAPATASKPIQSADELEDELDEIPEFQGFAAAEDDGSARNIAGEMIEDSDFSQAGAPVKKKPVDVPQDAALMAKAISTVLAKDK